MLIVKAKKQRQLALAVIVIVVTPLLFVVAPSGRSLASLCYSWWLLAVQVTPQTSFNPHGWRSHVVGDKDGPRSKMVNDLLTNRLRLGMRREEVRALLGEPDCKPVMNTKNNVDEYDLGHIGPFGIDPSILTIEYDKNGRVKHVDAGET